MDQKQRGRPRCAENSSRSSNDSSESRKRRDTSGERSFRDSSYHNRAYESREPRNFNGSLENHAKRPNYGKNGRDSRDNREVPGHSQQREPRSFNDRSSNRDNPGRYGKEPPSEPLTQAGRENDMKFSNTIKSAGAANSGTARKFQDGNKPRAPREEPAAFPSADKTILNTKPPGSTKKGNHARKVLFKTNYYRLPLMPQHDFIHYRVDFSPEVESTFIKKGLMKSQKEHLGGYLFDGCSLYLTQRLPKNPMVLMAKNRNDDVIAINIREVSLVSKTSYMAFQILNLVMRKALEGLRLQLVGRNYYDARANISIGHFRIDLWPGYVTSIRQHERDILLVVEIVHKVMRTENVYQILNDCIRNSRGRDYKEAFKKQVLGTTVLTDYNNKTYKIDDVDFDTTPGQTFQTKHGETSFVDYYKTKYNIIIKDPRQPMLISRAKARDIRAGMAEQIALIPELCRATGLTDDMRKNFQLMKACADHTRLDPMNYQRRLRVFNERLHNCPESTQALNQFNLKLDRELTEVHGAVLPAQTLVFGNDQKVVVSNANWDKEFRNSLLFNTIDLKNWFVIYPSRNKDQTQNFVDDLIKVAKGMKFRLDEPIWIEIGGDQMEAYSRALNEVINRDPRLIFVVVPNNRADRYSLVKSKTLIGRSIPSQVVVLKTITPKQNGNLMSIATKVAIQMNCKLGGVPWMIPVPLAALMTVGFDVYHDTRDKSRSYGALIATMDLQTAREPQHTKFFSSVSAHKNGEELSNDISINIIKALKEYQGQHGYLPKRMLFYRDGVGDGQIEYVKMHEVNQLQTALKLFYAENKEEYPRLTYIVVNKRISTKIFCGDRNPEPGSIVDDVITLPERCDFYMVAQSTRQGTVAPTSYNIIEDSFGIPMERLQELTYRFCHLYYNWGGTVRTPAVCQYAHKLAYLVGEYLHAPPSNGCEKSLYFL